jgi:cell wall-associated NlpC family hydrolase
MKTVSVLFLAILCSGCGGYSSPQQSSQPAVVPVVAAIVPNSANAGASAFTLTVNGSSFNNNAVVNWNGASRPTTHVTAQQLTAAIAAADVANAGTVTVSVTNPGSSTPGGPYGGGGSTPSKTSNTMDFTIN